MSRLRFTARLAVRDLLRSRGQAALVLATIAVPVLVGAAATTTARSLDLTETRQLDATIGPAATAWVDAYQRPGLVQSPTGSVRTDDAAAPAVPPTLAAYETALARVLGTPDDVHRMLVASPRWTGEDGRYRDGGYLIETDLTVPDVAAAFPLAAGRVPREPGEVVVDHALADALDLDPGATLTATPPPGTAGVDVAASRVSVVGVLRPVPGAADRMAAVGLPGTAARVPATLGDASQGSVRWIVTGPPVTWEQVQAVNALGSVVLSREVIARPPSAGQVAFPGDATATSDQDRALYVILGAAAVALAALMVAPAFAVAARRHRRELGLLSSVGAQGRDLRRVVVLQGVLAGTVASVAGAAGGIGVAAAIRGVTLAAGSVAMPDLRLNGAALALLVTNGIVSPTLAAWWPARQAAREDPVAALTGRPSVGGVPRERRRALTVAALAVGVLLSGAGVTASAPVLLGVGALTLLGGVLGSLGRIVGLLARLAPRLATPARYALRDADRRRSRTVPAVAGVLAAVALAVGAAGFSASYDAHGRAVYDAPSGVGTVRVAAPAADAGPDATTPRQWAALGDTLTRELPGGPVVPVRVGLSANASSPVWLDVAWVGGTAPSVPPLRVYPASWVPAADPNAPLVDDGTLVARLGLPGSAEAAAALAAGRVVVRWPQQVTPEGTARIGVGHAAVPSAVEVPATAVDLGSDRLRVIVPPTLADRLALRTVQEGLLAPSTPLPDVDAEHAALAALAAVVPGVEMAVERGPRSDGGAWTLALALTAAVLAAAAAGTCVALAAADVRPDLATLAAVGAPRRVRRGLAVAHAAVILVLGVGAGAVLGLAFAWAAVAGRRFGLHGVDPTWSFVWPWPVLALLVLAIPAVTLTGAWLLTPARLPLTRRLAG
ncbi:ABC transporter permease [Xylanimonas protaetiae]|uniref:FtsX-like permease family protein n=1 Tax=Xylanimonas protaetiae TaxID=2509457 RepID=A0A4P6FD96_9MICO|nr:ABC transporter permease [Xylanimonas protaetiae]QAY71577.1 FtsX-like permease family protein [Xylanimonas protaetiae]